MRPVVSVPAHAPAMLDDRFFRTLTFGAACKKQIRYVLKPSLRELAPRSYAIATQDTPVVTVLGGQTETRNLARAGDFVICGPDGEQYVVAPAKVVALYNLNETVLVPRKLPRRVARVTRADFERHGLAPKTTSAVFVAPWGEQMLLMPGDYVVQDGAKGHYRIEGLSSQATTASRDSRPKPTVFQWRTPCERIV
jgi:hypothetical protein